MEINLKTARLQPLHLKVIENQPYEGTVHAKRSINAKKSLLNNKQRPRIKTEPTDIDIQHDLSLPSKKQSKRFQEEYLILVNRLKVNLSKQQFGRKKSQQFLKQKEFISFDDDKSIKTKFDTSSRKNSSYSSKFQSKEKLKGLQKPYAKLIQRMQASHKGLYKIHQSEKQIDRLMFQNQAENQIKKHQKKLSSLIQDRKRTKKRLITAHQEHKKVVTDINIDYSYPKVTQLCFHIEILTKIYEICSQTQLVENDLLFQLKAYVLGNKKDIQGSQDIIYDDISHLEQIYTKTEHKKDLRTMIFMQRVVIVMTVDLISDFTVKKYLNEIKQILESLIGLYLYFIYELKQKHYTLSDYAQLFLQKMQTNVRKYSMHFRKQISSLTMFIYKKLFPIIKVNQILMPQIKMLLTQLESRNVSINRSFYELLKLYAIYLNNNQQFIEKNHTLMKTFATCPSPYLTKASQRPYTLVLNLDRTLVHTHDHTKKLQIFLRPFVKQFLNLLSEHFQIIIFTTQMPSQADSIIAQLPKISYSLYRYHVTRVRGKFLKDLSRLGRLLSKTIIVDIQETAYMLQKENGIKVSQWNGNDFTDQEFNVLGLFLSNMVKEDIEDVREYIGRYRQFRKKYQ